MAGFTLSRQNQPTQVIVVTSASQA